MHELFLFSHQICFLLCTQLDVSSNALDQSSKDELTKHKPPQLTLNM